MLGHAILKKDVIFIFVPFCVTVVKPKEPGLTKTFSADPLYSTIQKIVKIWRFLKYFVYKSQHLKILSCVWSVQNPAAFWGRELDFYFFYWTSADAYVGDLTYTKSFRYTLTGFKSMFLSKQKMVLFTEFFLFSNFLYLHI